MNFDDLKESIIPVITFKVFNNSSAGITKTENAAKTEIVLQVLK